MRLLKTNYFELNFANLVKAKKVPNPNLYQKQ